MVRCCEIAYQPICGEQKLLLVLNPAVGLSFLIMIKLIYHTAFMESRHFVTVLFLLFLLLLDLISSSIFNVFNAILIFP